MPIPKDFLGIFYSRSNGGDSIFDSSPEEFFSQCLCKHDVLAEFFIAGALTDLLWNARDSNGYIEIYKALDLLARAQWPNEWWSALPIIVLTAKAIQKDDVATPRGIENGVFKAVSQLFRRPDVIGYEDSSLASEHCVSPRALVN